MSQNIKIRKGVDIRLVGTPGDTVSAAKRVQNLRNTATQIFLGLTPKLIVKEGDTVKAGDSLFFEKKIPSINTLVLSLEKLAAIVRGAKRRIMSVIVEADATDSYIDHGSLDISKSSREEVLNKILEGGMFPFFGQRPFGVVAIQRIPLVQFMLADLTLLHLLLHNSVALDGRMKDFQNGINALAKLAGEGGVHLALKLEIQLTTKSKVVLRRHSVVLTLLET